MLSGVEFNKSKWRTHLQDNYAISARRATGDISAAKGAVDSAASGGILPKILGLKPRPFRTAFYSGLC